MKLPKIDLKIIVLVLVIYILYTNADLLKNWIRSLQIQMPGPGTVSRSVSSGDDDGWDRILHVTSPPWPTSVPPTARPSPPTPAPQMTPTPWETPVM